MANKFIMLDCQFGIRYRQGTQTYLRFERLNLGFFSSAFIVAFLTEFLNMYAGSRLTPVKDQGTFGGRDCEKSTLFRVVRKILN